MDFSFLLNKAGHEHVCKTWWEEIPLGPGEEENRTPRIKLSRKQKREQRRQYPLPRESRTTESQNPSAVICTITGDFRQSQHDDPKLKHAWQQALNPDNHVVGPKSRTIYFIEAPLVQGEETYS
ncbi:hypothetical protein NDU88_001765 [Pleurodeles waltl]|uniref:Uncharacterized protein n=1 Tax=Pleurodeles waltl TaxID=8319 RepID=A0AAV7T1D6_PLEWA|nr:hypothetical protein NDU88_001765 [Pleurodeles waltl]